MKVALIGPELEENLGLRYLHSCICRKGHKAKIFDFHAREQIPPLVLQILQYEPALIGLSMVFTGRADEFLSLAKSLRKAGFEGHITAGGHFASFHAQNLLRDYPALDSIVHGEGEEIIVDLIEHLSDLDSVSGISFRSHAGAEVKTSLRSNTEYLDRLAFPTRPAYFHTYLGLPIANLLGSRGCYGRCHYCSIVSWYKQNPGKRFRQRSVESIAREMGQLYHERGVRIFNFHDDNFFLPGLRQSVERFTGLQSRLESEGVGRIAIQVKARPDSIHEEAISVLKEIGLFRVFLGVESNSASGLQTLGRGIIPQQNHKALELLQNFDIHVTFNLLMFDPETTITDVRNNIDFMYQYAHLPLNFGRTEVYSGTPLEQKLRSENRLQGDYLGYSYIISHEHAQQVFEIYCKLFLPRNFEAEGMNLQAMRLDYYYYLLQHFYPLRAQGTLRAKIKRIIKKLNCNSAAMLSEICDFVGHGKTQNPASRDTFIRRQAEARRTFDADLSRQSQALLEEMKRRAGGSTRRNFSGPIAISAAAAIGIISVIGCDGNKSKEPPTKTSEDTINSQPYVRELSKEEVRAVETHVRQHYQASLPSWFRDINVVLNFQLDSKGKVISNTIKMTLTPDDPSLKKVLAEQIKTWTFPMINKEGRCKITLELLGTHMFEMMMRPIEPKNPRSSKE